MSRYHNTGRDDWSTPRQRRHADFGHGKIQSLIDDRPEGEPHPLAGVLILSAVAMIGAVIWAMLP